jgi:hypothetical protein
MLCVSSSEPPRRRRRRTKPAAEPSPLAEQQQAEPSVRGRRGAADKPGRSDRQPGRNGERDSDRAWRDLTGNAPSQVGVNGALRARDVARPTREDEAAAERDLPIIRRQWQPPEDTSQ